MKRSKAAIFGVLTYWPLIYILIFLITILSGVFNIKSQQDGGIPLAFKILFAVHLVTMVEILVLVVYYLVYLLKTDFVPSNKKAQWALFLFLMNIIAMPIFWRLYIWNNQKEKAPEQSVKGTKSRSIWVVIAVLITLVAFALFRITMLWPRLAPIFGKYPSVAKICSDFPGFEIRVWIDGKEFDGDDEAAVYNLKRSLLTIDVASNYVDMIKRTIGENALKGVGYWQLNDNILLAKSTAGRLMVQVDPDRVPKAKEFLMMLEQEMRVSWPNNSEASISTKKGMKPYRIEVVSSGHNSDKK
ncbi:MAG: hypothetical protein NTV49_03675 [Kiritimatiellaeota bacterium]|nr:hypothetical protein [Kiritimatiellota bacterium]